MRGYFGIGIASGKTPENLGTLWRSAYQFGAAFIFTIGKRYKRQCSDTYSTTKHVPLIEFLGEHDFIIPKDCQLVEVEIGGQDLTSFVHPERAMYILGAEDNGVPKWLSEKCVHRITIPSIRTKSFNVATAGAIVMYDRLTKQQKGMS